MRFTKLSANAFRATTTLILGGVYIKILTQETSKTMKLAT